MPWLEVIGTQEDGLGGLAAGLRDKIIAAGLVIGPPRLLDDVAALDGFGGETMAWPSPFMEIIPLLEQRRDTPVVILATGDPLWYGAASTLVRHFRADEMRITPAPSGFQLAASRMGWPLHECACLTVHGRPHEKVIRHLAPGARLLILAHDHGSAARVASLLDAAGYGEAMITALGHIGGADESRCDAAAAAWAEAGLTPPDFHVIAVACPGNVSGYLPPLPGLADQAYTSDGKLTKAETRAASLARLKPQPRGLLWDLGCGSGSIGIEWMRAASDARAIGVDNRQDRLDVARGNADRLGVPEWQGLCGDLPGGLDDLADPDAVFIGGGLSADLAEICMARLNPGGRLVANTVTLESEQVLLGLWQQHGGELIRLAISRADPVGPLHGWRPLMPVTQWVWEKPVGETR
ncbi:MAG: precorrin-6y C5,15-methyltransferase (decarboxylating) subunit CbiE [Candidatus Puniceispirillales bacterium]